MTDLDERFGSLMRTPTPDLWSNVTSREPRLLRDGPPLVHRALVATLALVIAAAATALSVRAFISDDVASRPGATISNGVLAFSDGGRIYAVSPDGSGLRQLADYGGHDALGGQWSPDGSKLAFRVWTNDNYELYVVDADGANATNVIGSLGVVHFDWSPDGMMLALTTSRNGTDYDVFVANADGTGLRPKIESPLNEYGPQWSPDGTQIAFERWPLRDSDPRTADIYVLDLVSGRTTPVVTSSGWDSGIAWSPDGSRIAFSSEREGNEEIYVVNVDGSGERRLTNLPGVDATSAAWSPDGDRISFVAHDGEQWDAWVVNADGTGLLTLTPTNRDDGPAVWSPDGRLLAFTASDALEGDNTGTYDLYTIRPDGTDERRVTAGQMAMGWDLSWQRVRVTDSD
jgi:Tol biopolymer transport system component